MTQPVSDALLYRTPQGAVFKVTNTPENIAKAEKSGWSPATDKDVRAALAREEAGTAGGIAKTALESVASGAFDAATAVPRLLTAGASKAFGTEDPLGRVSGRQVIEDVAGVGSELLGGQGAEAAAREYGEASRARAEVNPGTALMGTIAGQVIGSAGLGAAAKGAGVLATGALGGGLGARLAGAAAAGALEGAPLGMVAGQDTAYLENRRLTGEQALAAAGVGALLGGGLSLAAKASGEALGAIRSRVAGRASTELALPGVEEAAPRAAAADGAEAAAAEGEGAAARRVLRTGDGQIEAQGARVLGETPLPGFAENVRKAVSGESMGELRQAAHAEATEALTGELQRNLATANAMGDEVFNRTLKKAHVEANFAKGGIADDALDRTWEAASNVLSDLNEAVTSAEKRGPAPNVLVGLRDQVVANTKTIASAENPADAYMAMDQIRRDLHSTARSFTDSAGKTANVDKAVQMNALAERVGGHYDDAWKFLMDTETWGTQGAAQQEVNNAAVKFIEAKKYAFPHFAEKVGDAYQGVGKTRPVYEVHDGKVASLVQKFGSPQGAFAERRFGQYLQAASEFSQAVSKAYELPAELAGKVTELQKGATQLQKTFTAMTDKVGSLNQVETFMSAAKQGGDIQGSGILGGILGGHLGAAAGFAIGAATNPAKFLAQRIALDQMATRAQRLVGKSLDALFEGGANLVTRAPTAIAKASEGARTAAAPVAVPTALVLFQGKHATPEIAYDKRVQELYNAQQNYGGQVRDRVAETFGPAASHEREAMAAMTTAGTRAVDYLLGRAPVPLYQTGTLMPLTNRPVPARGAISQFAREWAAVMKPETVLRDIASGRVTGDQIDAIQYVYPDYYDWMRDEILARIRARDAAKEPIPLRTRMMLDVVLKLNGAGEPTLTNDFAAKYSAVMSDAANPPPAPRPRPGPTTLAKSASTQTTNMLGGQ